MRLLLWLALALSGLALGTVARAEDPAPTPSPLIAAIHEDVGGHGDGVGALGERVVVVGRIEGVISPVTAQYVERVLGNAEARDVAAVVFTIDTPGGLIGATFRITNRLLNAQVPVITYVAPRGARAASAGTFITMAGHVAAMAPSTVIGAAHPVGGSGESLEGDTRAKAENYTVSEAQKIALARDRSVQWAEDAVRKSASIRDDEAVKLDVVDFVAEDIEALLRRADGRQVQLANGERVTLALSALPRESDEPNIFETILHTIVDPQIALLLFTLGVYGLIFELSNPGLILPGIVGGLAVILALYAFGTLDANAAGIALLVFAVVLFIAEIKVVSHGLLTAGGIVAMVLGAILLFPPRTPTLPGVRVTIDPVVIGAITAITAGFFLLILQAALRSRALPVVTGIEALQGALGVAESDLDPTGLVRVGGEPWTAATASGRRIAKGERVRVRQVDSVRLIVEPADRPDGTVGAVGAAGAPEGGERK